MRETYEPDDAFFTKDRLEDLRRRWTDVQARFVDDPRAAVKQAHTMVAEMVSALTETFTRERARLEDQWNRDENPDTEALRVALRRYRDFFDRLLASSESTVP